MLTGPGGPSSPDLPCSSGLFRMTLSWMGSAQGVPRVLKPCLSGLLLMTLSWVGSPVLAPNKVTQSCPTLSDLMDCSPLGSSVHGIFQERVLEWGAIAFSASLVGQWWRICLQCRRSEFGPWVGKVPWRREWKLVPVLLPGEFHRKRSLAVYSPQGLTESHVTAATK